MAVKCRRCSECRDNSHHWMSNPRVGITDNEPSWVCKHCPARGEDCPKCMGADEECPICQSEGVLPLEKYRRFKAVSEKAARAIMDRWGEWEGEAGQDAQRYQMPEAGEFLLRTRLQGVIERAICEALNEQGAGE